jgi:hypothetical protein
VHERPVGEMRTLYRLPRTAAAWRGRSSTVQCDTEQVFVEWRVMGYKGDDADGQPLAHPVSVFNASVDDPEATSVAC